VSTGLTCSQRIFIIIGSAVSILCLQSGSHAEDQFTPVYNPSLEVKRTAGEIKIDGKLDDDGWKNAAVADNFAEHQPGDQVKPPVDTRAMITYDDKKLYVAYVCYDDPAAIRASYSERDRIYHDDNVGFFFDTYGDAAWAYTLNINPYGIQADGLWTSGFGEDSRYDLIWESAGQITDSGYQVELAIPFSSLRFPDKPQQTWKVDFWRHHRRDSHYQISWAAYDRNEPCWPCQWGTVTGIENVKPGKGIEIIPAVIAYQSGELQVGEYAADSTRPISFENEDIKGELSLSGKYAVTSDITAEATFNPDFSQVEADADQIDVNTTTALSFPERRPFFQEGRDLFRSLFNIVYTRSINDPLVAAKFTARLDRTSIAYLGAVDEDSPVIIPFEEGSSDPIHIGRSFSNIARVRKTFGTSSQAGIMVTDRRYEIGGSGSTLGADGSFRLTQNFQFRWQAVASHTEEPNDPTLTCEPDDTLCLNEKFDGTHTAAFDGESFWGHAYIGLLDYDARDIFVSGRYSEMSPTFRADNGYEPQNNRRQASVIAAHVLRMDQGLFQWFESRVFAAKIWNTAGKPKDAWISFNLETLLRKAQINFETEFLLSAENYQGVQFDDIWSVKFEGHALPSHQIGFGGEIEYGNRIVRDEVAMGKETNIGGWLDLRPTKRIYLENWLTYSQSRLNETGDMAFKGFIARSRLSLQFNRELSLRFVVQYNDFHETWDFDPLITYRLSPFSLFYIGTTYDYARIYGMNEDGSVLLKEEDEGYIKTRLISRQFFMKLQYQFQL
jgi:hypothetical protein